MKKLDTVPNGEMIIYENSDGKTIIDVRFDEDTLWLTQMQTYLEYKKQQYRNT